jgi:TIR domain/Putative Ig domain
VPAEPAAFMSYVHLDNDQYDGQLGEFRRLLATEVRAQTGQEFVIFQDREHISWGQNWQERIDDALDVATLLIVIITPGFFRSQACRAEVARFLERERELGRSDLILPLYYITAREVENPAARESDELARVLGSRQYADWRELRFEPSTSPVVRKAIGQLASRMRDSFWHPDSGSQASPRTPPEHNTLIVLQPNAEQWSVHAVYPTSAAVGTPYANHFTVTNGVTVTWAVTAGSLPPGLSLNTITGTLTGTPTRPGSYHFTVVARNVATGKAKPGGTYNFTVYPVGTQL